MYRQKKSVSVLCGLLFVLLFAAGSFCGSACAKENAVADACRGVVRLYAFHSSDGSGGTGTGFGVGKAGRETDIFITNWHVVCDQETGEFFDEIYILLDNTAAASAYDSVTGRTTITNLNYDRMVRCEILYATDGYPDFAILKAAEPVEGRIALPLYESEKVEVASDVYALGYPSSSDVANDYQYLAALVSDVTTTKGVVSRFTTMAWAKDTKVIQNDAQINHGNSGGPLVTADGAVVAINTYGFGTGSQGDSEMYEHTASVYIDYVMDELDELDISYDVYGEKKTVLFIVLAVAAVLGCAGVAVVFLKKRRAAKRQGADKAAPEDGRAGQPEDLTVDQTVRDSRGGAFGQSSFAPTQSDAGQQQWGGRPGAYPGERGTVELFPKDPLRIQGKSGLYAGRRFPLEGTVTMGRNSGNNLVWPPQAMGVSSSHCTLLLQDGNAYIQDNGSTYGTFLNGRRLAANRPYALQRGDIFCLGSEAECFQITGKGGMV